MSILVFSGRRNALGDQLQGVIEERCPNRSIERYTGIRQLSRRLRRSLLDVEAGVLLATSERDLDGLLSVENTISSLPLILILPEAGREVVSKAHKLRPRYLTCPQNTFGDVAVVLQKILERSERLRSAEGVS